MLSNNVVSCLKSSCEYLYTCNADFICVHDSYWSFNTLTVFGYILIIIIIGISTVGGLGGGIEKVPILMVMLNYTQKTATFYTYALMFGANLANYFMLVIQRHPDFDKPIIDYDIALILLPTNLFGSALGTILNKMCPDILLLIVNNILYGLFFIQVFILLMLFLIPGLLTRAKTMSKVQEGQEQQNQTLLTTQVNKTQQYPDPDDSMLQKKNSDTDYLNSTEEGVSVELAQLEQNRVIMFNYYLTQEKQLIPKKSVLIIFSLFLISEFIILLRGGKEIGTSFVGIQFCSMWYWLDTGFITIFLILMTFTNKWYVSNEQKKMQDCLYLNKNVQRYTWGYYLKIWSAGMAGGLMGGMLGVGAGSLMVPLLIIFNVNSRVAAATAGFSKVFISAASLFMAYNDGDMEIDEILFFFTLSIIGGCFLTSVIYYYVNKHKKNSEIIYIVASFLMLNVISAILYILKESLLYSHWSNLSSIQGYC